MWRLGMLPLFPHFFLPMGSPHHFKKKCTAKLPACPSSQWSYQSLFLVGQWMRLSQSWCHDGGTHMLCCEGGAHPFSQHLEAFWGSSLACSSSCSEVRICYPLPACYPASPCRLVAMVRTDSMFQQLPSHWLGVWLSHLVEPLVLHNCHHFVSLGTHLLLWRCLPCVCTITTPSILWQDSLRTSLRSSSHLGILLPWTSSWANLGSPSKVALLMTDQLVC